MKKEPAAKTGCGLPLVKARRDDRRTGTASTSTRPHRPWLGDADQGGGTALRRKGAGAVLAHTRLRAWASVRLLGQRQASRHQPPLERLPRLVRVHEDAVGVGGASAHPALAAN